jgi:glycerol-3-phosphate dehydrogenase
MPEHNLAHAARERYDIAIVGGGILGSMILLESALRGQRAVLLERGAFGGATSANSLRILHGGLRYLQSLDLPRFFESVRERRWFLQTFPDLTEPLACVMPLYGRGMKRSAVLRLALAINDMLSSQRNRGVRADRHLPPSRLCTAAEVREACAFVEPAGLTDGALWYDARMLDSGAIVREVLSRATSVGAVALDHVEVDGLEVAAGRVAAVRASDRRTSERFTFEAARVVNAAGPWAPQVLQRFGDRVPHDLHFAVAWNLLVDRRMRGSCAVALTAPHSGAQTFFAYPSGDQLLIGTGHAPWGGDLDRIGPDEQTLAQFLSAVNAAAPALELTRSDVRHVFAGLLPTTAPGSSSLTQRPTIIDHGARGGDRGLYTAVGIKFTTSHDTASKLLKAMGFRPARAPAA